MAEPFDTTRTARRSSQITIKTVLTVSITLVGVGTVLWALWHAQIALALIAASAFLAVALDHAVSWLQARRLSRRLAVTLVMSLLVAGVTAFGFAFIPPVVKQGRSLSERTPQLLQELKRTRGYAVLNSRFGIDEKIGELQEQAPELVQPGKRASVDVLSEVAKGIAAVVTIFFLVLFMLLFGPKLVAAAMAEATPERRARYEGVVRKIYRSIGGYLSGLSLICAVNAVVTTSFLAAMRVPYFLPLGVLSGLSSSVPLAGNVIMGIGITLIAFATVGLWTGVAVGAFYVLYQQFENHLLGPLVYRRTIHVNPLLVVLALLFFAELGGVVGAVIAVPLVAALQIIVREVLQVRREQLRLAAAGAPPPPPREG